jgi:DNA-binding response OmpR family regulator
LGADLYLTKPFSIKKVIEQVQELLAWWHSF